MTPTKMIYLSCSCCLGDAPALKQWWNRDAGYGLCGKCAARFHDEGGPEFERSYGLEGVHWFAATALEAVPHA